MKAFITGITGQDGSYLAELLLNDNIEVIGLVRRSSTDNLSRISHLVNNKNLTLITGDLSDSNVITTILAKFKPDEIYNLAAQSHVQVSFENPVYTSDIDGLGPLRILESIRTLKLKSKFYQASTSELYGKVLDPVQNENTPFNPQSPYAIAKRFAFDMIKLYREAYGIFACNGILFNHESPRRGENFVTRKITKAVANIAAKKQECLYLGNLNSCRDWGHAKDYCEAMIKMLRFKTPEDFVIATGETHSVRDFVKIAFDHVNIPITFKGSGINEVGIDPKGRELVKVDPKFYRPAEVDYLIGNSSKAKLLLNWEPKYSFQELVKEMMNYDIKSVLAT